MMNSVSDLFTRDAGGYDDLRRKLVPCFDGFYGSALTLIARWHPDRHFRVLDLGAGTGLFSAFVRDAFPETSVCLMDTSIGMLDEARARFAGKDDVAYRVGDMGSEALDGPWDLVISALAIHHLPDSGKRDLYARILAALAPGGLFINAEQVAGPDAFVDAEYGRIWEEDIRALGVSEAELEKAKQRMLHDRCAPLGEQLNWLEEIGFAHVDCCFKSWRFAVFSGQRV